MSDCIKYPILFNDKKSYISSKKNKLYEKDLDNNKSKDYSNSSENTNKYDSEFENDCSGCPSKPLLSLADRPARSFPGRGPAASDRPDR